jgi:hypothetical protein
MAPLRGGRFISWPILTVSIRIEALASRDSAAEKASRSLTIGFSKGGFSMINGLGIFLGHPERRSPKRKNPSMKKQRLRIMIMPLSKIISNEVNPVRKDGAF